MTDFKLLLIEDSDEDIKTCIDSIKRYNAQHGRNIDLNVAKSLEDALQILDSSCDGVIIDLQLNENKSGGNDVFNHIQTNNLRMPFAFFTATPDAIESDYIYIGTYKKGETEYIELIEKFWKIHQTGLTKIMGGRGLIETVLNEVFTNHLLPHQNTWIDYGQKNSEQTQKSLLRHTLNHLVQLLDDGSDKFFPEEVYIHPWIKNQGIAQPGKVVSPKESESLFIIMTPACDLAIRPNGEFKTDRILLIEVEPKGQMTDKTLRGAGKNEEKIKRKLHDLFNNNGALNYHFLPSTSFFNGGFLNFRKVCSVGLEEYQNDFQEKGIKITAPFLKDILSRFSAYYARQGQPLIDFDGEITTIIAESQQQ